MKGISIGFWGEKRSEIKKAELGSPAFTQLLKITYLAAGGQSGQGIGAGPPLKYLTE
jgi:hypothetical protein